MIGIVDAEIRGHSFSLSIFFLFRMTFPQSNSYDMAKSVKRRSENKLHLERVGWGGLSGTGAKWDKITYFHFLHLVVKQYDDGFTMVEY